MVKMRLFELFYILELKKKNAISTTRLKDNKLN